MGFFSTVFNGFLKIVPIILAIAFIPGIPPHMEFEAYSLTPPLPLEGTLALNGKLNNIEKLFVGKIKGPEHLEIYNGVLYTTLEDGYVAKISIDKVVPIIKFGKKCDELLEPEICGRPLGLSFSKEGFMYVADAYYGVFKVNISSGEYEHIVTMDTDINGKPPKLPNSLAVARDGTVYWSDSSSTHSLYDGLYIMLGNGNGRLIKYDPKTKTNTVLIDKLHVANGVVLSQDESFVLVSDLFRSRILKYNLKGSRAGKTEVFIDGLPGCPDNLHSNGKGEFHATFAINIDRENPGLPAVLGPYPLLRKFIARLLYLLELPAHQIELYYPNYYTKMYTNWIGSLTMMPTIMTNTKRNTVIFFNEEGKITRSTHSNDGKVGSLSDIALFQNYYYLGSFSNPFLGKVKAS